MHILLQKEIDIKWLENVSRLYLSLSQFSQVPSSSSQFAEIIPRHGMIFGEQWFVNFSVLTLILMLCIESENLIYVVIPKVFIKTKICHPKIKATRILRDDVIWRKSISNPSMISPNLMKLTFFSYVCRFVDNENDLTEKLS